jgi:hypothetical protein
MSITKCRIWAQPVNRFTVRPDVLLQCGAVRRWSLGLMEVTMRENKSTEKTRQLTEDELSRVSGGKGEAPVKYMEYKLKEVLISGVTLSS